MSQYYFQRLNTSSDGSLFLWDDEMGSVSLDPHSLFPKQMRESWRRLEREGYAPIRSTRGLMYACWKLPLGRWTTQDAYHWIAANRARADVYAILGTEGQWKPTLLAVHPHNPITFKTPMTFEEH